MPVFERPGTSGSKIKVEDRYGHYIGGEFVPPIKGEYFDNYAPQTGQVFTQVGRGTAEDIEAALDAGTRGRRGTGRRLPA